MKLREYRTKIEQKSPLYLNKVVSDIIECVNFKLLLI